MFVAEHFLSNIVKDYEVSSLNRWWHMVSNDLSVSKIKASPSFYQLKDEKSLIERTMQYVKDRTESFDDYFPCRKNDCKLSHVRKWMNLFLDYHNSELKMLK